MAAKQFVKINLRGGLLTTGDLGTVVALVKTYATDTVQLGERQTLLFPFEKKKKSALSDALTASNLDFEINASNFPNIVSSYAAEDIYSKNTWMSEGLYRDILASFDYKPTLKINIVDHTQALVPLFTGNINFITSPHQNYYYVYVNHSTLSRMEVWNKLIYGTDIPTFSRALETKLANTSDCSTLLSDIEKSLKLNTKEVEQPLLQPRLRFPYYEGMNTFGDKFWLGIYRRNNDFSLELLESLYSLCVQTKIGFIHLTAWKSLMIKGIKEEERILWEKFLSKNGVNSRHSASELNWKLPDNDKEAIRIKKDLVKGFEEIDFRTYGISFAVQTGDSPELNCAVVIKKRPGLFPFWGIFKKFTVFEIWYSPTFSLNATSHILYTSNITWNGLAINLSNLCELYYKQLTETKIEPIVKEKEKKKRTTIHHYCSHCFTVYDEASGDPEQNIGPNTPFAELPPSYTCSLCESPIADFLLKEKEILVN